MPAHESPERLLCDGLKLKIRAGEYSWVQDATDIEHSLMNTTASFKHNARRLIRSSGKALKGGQLGCCTAMRAVHLKRE